MYSCNSVSARRLRRFVSVSLAGTCAGLSVAQHRLMIPDPYGTAERLEVFAFDGASCQVNTGYGMETVTSGQYFFEEGDSYAEGYIEINSPTGFVSKDKSRSTFDFSVKVRSSREFADCYLVLQLYTQDGREFLLPYEIEDLKPGKAQRVRINPELGVDMHRGVYYYHFFSGGEEIYFALTRQDLGRKHPPRIPLDFPGTREPALAQAPDTEVPSELGPLVSGNEALIAIGVNDSGFSVDHLVLSASNRVTERVAVDLVKNARFTPASEEGIYVRKDMLLRVVFDIRGRYQLVPEG